MAIDVQDLKTESRNPNGNAATTDEPIGPTGVRAFVAVALAVWLGAVVVLGARGSFVLAFGTAPFPIGLGFAVPLMVFLAAYWLSAPFRAFLLAGDLPLLTAVQAWRFAGFGFIALMVYGVLPGSFAWPAGLGYGNRPDRALAGARPGPQARICRQPAVRDLELAGDTRSVGGRRLWGVQPTPRDGRRGRDHDSTDGPAAAGADSGFSRPSVCDAAPDRAVPVTSAGPFALRGETDYQAGTFLSLAAPSRSPLGAALVARYTAPSDF